MALKGRATWSALTALILSIPAWVATGPASALTIEIDDVAPDRVERQRAYAEGALPLAGTPELGQFKERLSGAGLKLGDEVFIRIFKAESELEVWMRRGATFTLFATYPICHWAGTIGPKLREGDRQNPEGFYSVGARQLHRAGRWPSSLNIGFPNSYDKANGRTGSWILVHGGCSSIGCYAMTNAVMAEIFALTEQALRAGQGRIDVHVFPFRMSDTNLARHAASPWIDFWRNLKEGYDAFEETHVPPRVGLCDKRYAIERSAPEEVGAQGPLASCGGSPAAQVEPSSQSLAALPPQWPLQPEASYTPPTDPLELDWANSRRLAARLFRMQGPAAPARHPQAAAPVAFPAQQPAQPMRALPAVPAQLLHPSVAAAQPTSRRVAVARTTPCNPGLASCRRFLALDALIESRKANARTAHASARATSHGSTRHR